MYIPYRGTNRTHKSPIRKYDVYGFDKVKLETWLTHPPEYFQEPWEGTLWALIALGIWCDHHGVV